MLSFIPQWAQNYLEDLLKVKEVIVGLFGFSAWAYSHYKARFNDREAELIGLKARIDVLEKKNKELKHQNEEFDAELERVSPTRTLAYKDRQLADGNDGPAFSRLTSFVADIGPEIAEICAHLVETRIGYALATGRPEELREAYRLASIAEGLAPDRKEYREFHDEIGLRLTGEALAGETPESEQEIFDWLHLKDEDDVRGVVSALNQETLGEIRNGHYALALASARVAHRLARQRLRRDDSVRLESDFRFAQSLSFAGRYDEALLIAQATWEKYQSILPPDHPHTLVLADLVAQILDELGRHAEALPIAKETWEREKSVLPSDHPDTLASAGLVAQILDDLGRHAEALPIAQATWEKYQSVLPPDHPDTLGSAFLVAQILDDLGRHAEALPIAQATWEKRQSVLPPDHPYTLVSAFLVARILGDLGRHAEALPIVQATWEKFQIVLPLDHPDTLASACLVAQILNDLGRHAEALPIAQATWEKVQIVLPPDHPFAMRGSWLVAKILHNLERDVEALPIAREAWDKLNSILPTDHRYVVQAAELVEAITKRNEDL